MPLSNCVNLLGRGTKVVGGSTPGIGNVVGPASSTDTSIVRWSGTTGKIIKDSNVTLADSGTSLVFSGAAGLTASGVNQSITLTPSGTGSNVMAGSTFGSVDDTFLAWDAGNNRMGFTKKSGNAGFIAHASATPLVIARSGSTSIIASNTFTTEITVATTGNLLLGGLTTDGTGVLQFPAATTSAGGATFGDVNLFQSSSGTMAFTSASAILAQLRIYSVGTQGSQISFGYNNSTTTKGAITYNGIATDAMEFKTAGTTALTLDSGQLIQVAKTISSYNGVATSGWGVPAIQASGRATAQSAANASISTYTVGAADGSFEVSANMNVTAATVLSTTLQVSYTDESNTARSMILPVQQLGGSFIAGGLITATGAWESATMHIRCKASTAITVLTAAGTFNTVTYTAEGLIRQLK